MPILDFLARLFLSIASIFIISCAVAPSNAILSNSLAVTDSIIDALSPCSARVSLLTPNTLPNIASFVLNSDICSSFNPRIFILIAFNTPTFATFSDSNPKTVARIDLRSPICAI